MVDFTTMIHAVRRSNCVWASVVTTVHWATSLAVLIESLIGGPQVSFLRRCSKIFLLIFWWPAVIRINVVYWFGVASLVVVIAGSWSFVEL
jgi:hypothetical protein